jgi:alkylation response protein AidB-like acyl-CoA dehydrogenase
VDFIFTEEQDALRQISGAALERLGGLEPARRIVDDPEATGEVRGSVQDLAAKLGWLGLGVAEDDGGSGGTIVEQLLVAIELGRVASPFNLANAAMSARCFSEGAGRRLAGLPDGFRTGSWALANIAGSWGSPGVSAAADSEGWVLTGEPCYVEGAADATDLIVPAREEFGDTALFCIPLPEKARLLREQTTLDLTRGLFHVRLDHQRVTDGDRIAAGPAAIALLDDVVRIGTLLTAAESLGAAEALLKMTVAHLQDRVQFGRALATFQALKHRCADMKIALETTRTLILIAAMHQRDATPQAARLVSMAKARSAQACVTIAGEALQLHGGIGMTWEHDLHLLLRRIRVNALLFGGLNDHRRRVLAAALDGVSAHAA